MTSSSQVVSGLLKSGFDRRDLDRGVVLTMPVLANVVLAPAELEDHQLFAAALLDDLAGDLGACDDRRADGDVATISRGHEQDVVEHDRRAGRAGELLDHHGLARLDSILFSTRLDHGVHGNLRKNTLSNRGLY